MKSSFDTDIDVTKVELTNKTDKNKTGAVSDNAILDYGYNDSGAESKDDGYTVRKILTEPRASRDYRYTSSEDLINNLDDLRDFIIEHHQYQVPRLDVLNKYYMGQNVSIYLAERRRLEADKSDSRIANSYAKLITETQVSYITSKSIEITSSDAKLKTFIDDINKQNDIDSYHKDLLTDMSVFGRAYEHIYRTEDGDFIGLSDVMSTFIIYDLTIQKKPIAAVRYILLDMADNKRYVSVELYTDDSIYTFELTPFDDDLEFKLKTNKDKTPNPLVNSYGMIPIIEYKNTNRGKGDFEDVIDLIDAYDSVQSDTANYSRDTPDAMYQITGRLADGMLSSDVLKTSKNANMVYLKPGIDEDGKEYNLKGEYVNPTYDVVGMEAFKKRLVSEIHKQSKTPDLSDEHFGGNQTGIAMKYKLYGIDQSASIKMSEFIRGSKRRYNAIKSLKNNVDSGSFDFNMNDLTFNFTKNIPINDAELLTSAIAAGVKLSNKTLIEYLPFVNTDIELQRLEDEAIIKNELAEKERLYTEKLLKEEREYNLNK